MRKIIIIIAVIILVVVAYQSGKPQFISDTYQLNGIVTEETDHNTIIETTDGNVWEVYTVHGVVVGDRVMLTLDGHNTTDITDDTIIDIKTIG